MKDSYKISREAGSLVFKIVTQKNKEDFIKIRKKIVLST